MFLFSRFVLLIQTANVIKYRTEIICFSLGRKQLKKINTSIHTVPKLTTVSRRFKKVHEWHKTSFSLRQFLFFFHKI